ncbi:MAG: hypothetical protein WCS77_08135 [Elusimicrobiaceae bacterium]
MSWIESHQKLYHHPQTLLLAELMDWEVDLTIGKLHRFWWWCMDYAEDGDLRKYNDATLAQSVGLRDTDGKRFVDAMVRSGWIEREPYFRLHSWWKHRGQFLQKKYRNSPKVWHLIKDNYAAPFPVKVSITPDALLQNTTKHNRTTTSSADADALLPANAEPTPKPAKAGYSPEFELFWKAYPRKVGKSAAYARWRSKSPPLDAVLAALKVQKRCEQWQDITLIPHPETWLNQRRWEDDPAAYSPAKQKNEPDNYAYEEAEAMYQMRRANNDS